MTVSHLTLSQIEKRFLKAKSTVPADEVTHKMTVSHETEKPRII